MVVCRRGAVRLVIRSSGVCFGGGGGVLLRRFPGSSHAKTGEQGSAAAGDARATYASLPAIWPITVLPNTSYHFPALTSHAVVPVRKEQHIPPEVRLTAHQPPIFLSHL